MPSSAAPRSWFAYLIFIGGVLCPLAWLLGQTVPILTNLMRAERSGEAAGRALYWSTLGSFLGSVTLSLGMMQLFGVWSAVLLGTLLLVAGAALVERPQALTIGLLAGVSRLALVANLGDRQRVDTAYADYAVLQVTRAGMVTPRAFLVNNQFASLMDSSEPPVYAAYVEHLRHILLDDLKFAGRDILVLGAGGFTLSHREPLNRYTYVDIDPAIRTIAERDFLREAGKELRGDRCPPLSSWKPGNAMMPWWWMSSAPGPPFPATWSPASSGRTLTAPSSPAACCWPT